MTPHARCALAFSLLLGLATPSSARAQRDLDIDFDQGVGFFFDPVDQAFHIPEDTACPEPSGRQVTFYCYRPLKFGVRTRGSWKEEDAVRVWLVDGNSVAIDVTPAFRNKRGHWTHRPLTESIFHTDWRIVKPKVFSEGPFWLRFENQTLGVDVWSEFAFLFARPTAGPRHRHSH